jgi:hypothetical protein
MTTSPTTRQVDFVLSGLFIFDVILTSWVFFAPDLWFRVFHGVPYNDPEGFLRRCGANWAAFALFQGIARLRWKQNVAWIAVVAGVRLSDIFTDWTYLYFAADMTPLGTLGLLGASPMNMIAGWWLWRVHRSLSQEVALTRPR